MEELIDITKVCEHFHISSRTLRFYEEKGLIESIRTPSCNHRSYTKEQVDKSVIFWHYARLVFR